MADSVNVEQTSDMAPYISENRKQALWEQFLQPWPKLFDNATSGNEEYIIPTELLPSLNYVPEQNMDDKLAQILKWSLQRESQFATPVKEESDAIPRHHSITSRPPTPETEQINTTIANDTAFTELVPPSETTQEWEVRSQNQAEPDSPLRLRLLKFAHNVATKINLTPTSDENGATSLSVINPVKFGECISCFDEHPKGNLTNLPCSHDYCGDCLREVVMNAIKTESAFPPKCCLTEIPLKNILSCLDAKQREEYKDKAAEYSIPAGYRWYCPDPHCAKWIPPSKLHQQRHSSQRCPHCHISICSTCRGNSHNENEDCPQDFGVGEVLDIAQYEGWRRCDNCRTMVEHNEGCRHMTCKCGYQFCYVCTARWKTCACSESDAERRRTELRARRMDRDQRLQEEERQREVEDEEALAEYREIEEAIRQVEEQERLEAEERAQEEERLLAELESQRIAEEESRREEELRQEEELRNLLLQSCSEECAHMREQMFEISLNQQEKLSAQHSACRDAIEEKFNLQASLATLQQEQKTREAYDSAQSQMDDLFKKHQKEWSDMCKELEDEEDEVFMKIELHLRNKPNREAREQSMRSRVQKSSKERKLHLQGLHGQQRTMLIERCQRQIAALQASFYAKPDPYEQEHAKGLREIISFTKFERSMFELVIQRRIAMIEEHERIMLAQIEAGEEPEGLTEEAARMIQPQLPEVTERLESASVARLNSWDWNDDQQIVDNAVVEQRSAREAEDMYGPPQPTIQHPPYELADQQLVLPPLQIQTSQSSTDAPLTPPHSVRTISATSLLSPAAVPETWSFKASTAIPDTVPTWTAKATKTTPGSFPLTPRISRDSTTLTSIPAPESTSAPIPAPPNVAATSSARGSNCQAPQKQPPKQVYGVTGALMEAFRTTSAPSSSASGHSNAAPLTATELLAKRKEKEPRKGFFGFGKGKDKHKEESRI